MAIRFFALWTPPLRRVTETRNSADLLNAFDRESGAVTPAIPVKHFLLLRSVRHSRGEEGTNDPCDYAYAFA